MKKKNANRLIGNTFTSDLALVILIVFKNWTFITNWDFTFQESIFAVRKHEQHMSASSSLCMLLSKNSLKNTVKKFVHLVWLSWSMASESKLAYSRSSRLSQTGWIDWADLN